MRADTQVRPYGLGLFHHNLLRLHVVAVARDGHIVHFQGQVNFPNQIGHEDCRAAQHGNNDDSAFRTGIRTACTITLFTTAASAFTYFVDTLMPQQAREYATLICYTVIIGVLYALFLLALSTFGREKFQAYKKYVHLSAFNCAVMGTLFTISEKSSENISVRDTIHYFLRGLEAGAGFVVAALFLAMAYKKLNLEKVPALNWLYSATTAWFIPRKLR